MVAIEPGMFLAHSVVPSSGSTAISTFGPALSPTASPMNSAARQLVHIEAGRGVRHVIVDGRVVVRDRALTTVDEATIYEAVKVVMEETAAAEAMSLEKGMIVLSTAVAGGPFIGLLGTVWGVMETFAGIANAGSASLTAMAPGVAGALICTVIGLLVAIPAMFGYNFMVTTIRNVTQELDGFATRYANQIEHTYVDNRDIEEKIAGALKRNYPVVPAQY